MFSYFVYYLFIIVSGHALVANEEFRCDVPCEQSCETLDATVPCSSEKVCRNFCMPGYVRDHRHRSCIPPYECPSCFGNETYRGEGINCLTCENYRTARCRVLYKTGCYCRHGYVRTPHGQCILPTDCPNEDTKCTKLNERFTTCFIKSCERTCSNRLTPKACPKLCRNGGCICQAGFIRDDETEECIDEYSCSDN